MQWFKEKCWIQPITVLFPTRDGRCGHVKIPQKQISVDVHTLQKKNRHIPRTVPSRRLFCRSIFGVVKWSDCRPLTRILHARNVMQRNYFYATIFGNFFLFSFYRVSLSSCYLPSLTGKNLRNPKITGRIFVKRKTFSRTFAKRRLPINRE